MNSKNDNAKKDLRLSYLRGNKSAYPTTIERMAGYLSTQYPNKPPNNRRDKQGDKNLKKGSSSKSEDKDSDNTGTAGSHMVDVTTPQDSTAPSNGSSIGAHVSETKKPIFCQARSVEELLAAHSVNDAILSHTNPSDVSIDTTNSVEIMARSHIMEEHTFTFCRSYPHELLNVAAHMPRKDDLS